jgi:hypothetical protein
MEIEPWQERVRCAGCSSSWTLRESTFYCSCGNVFESAEVESAVSEVVRATRRLYEELKRRTAEVSTLEQKADASFAIWMQQTAHFVGGAAGYLVGRLIRLLGI